LHYFEFLGATRKLAIIISAIRGQHRFAADVFIVIRFSVSESKAQSSPASFSFFSDLFLRGLAIVDSCIISFWAQLFPLPCWCSSFLASRFCYN